MKTFKIICLFVFENSSSIIPFNLNPVQVYRICTEPFAFCSDATVLMNNITRCVLQRPLLNSKLHKLWRCRRQIRGRCIVRFVGRAAVLFRVFGPWILWMNFLIVLNARNCFSKKVLTPGVDLKAFASGGECTDFYFILDIG